MAGLTANGRLDCYNGTNGGLRGRTRYYGLIVGDPDASGVEVSATGYARLARTAAQQPVATTGDDAGKITVNAGDWASSVTASWGTPTHVGSYDAPIGGNLKWSAPISPALMEILTGARVYIEGADITFEIPLS